METFAAQRHTNSVLVSVVNLISCTFYTYLSPDRYTDTGLLELEVQFVGIGKFADTKKKLPSSLKCKKR